MTVQTGIDFLKAHMKLQIKKPNAFKDYVYKQNATFHLERKDLRIKMDYNETNDVTGLFAQP